MAAGRNVIVVRGAVCMAVCLFQAGAIARCTEEPPKPVQPTPAPAPAPAPDKQPPKQPETKPSETKSVETKPVETKPTDIKPIDPKTPPDTTAPATTPDPYTTPANPTLPKIDITLGGKVFHLEQALKQIERYHGLSGRTEIAPDGGMIFVFKEARKMDFVMRDCPADIDIIFVNALGHITAMHNMKAGPRRTEEEKKLFPPYANAPKEEWSNSAYEAKLKKYTSRFDACIVIELKGGTLNINGSFPGGLEFKPNDKLDLDVKALQEKAE